MLVPPGRRREASDGPASAFELHVSGQFRMSGSNVTNFVTIDPATSGTVVNVGVNDAGEVVGSYVDATGVQHGFIDSSGVVSSFDIPGAAETDITGVTNGGQVIGYSLASGPTGTADAVGFSGAPSNPTSISVPGQDIEPVASDGALTVVGTQDQSSFVDVSGTVTTLNVTSAIETTATDVNATDEIVGSYLDANYVQHGFTDIGGTFATIDPSGSQSTSIAALNATGELAGSYVDASGNTFGFTDLGGVVTTIPASNAATPFTVVTGINAAGTVVGYEEGVDDQLHGFIDQNGAISVFDLAGSVTTEPSGINDSGLIVGTFTDANGVEQAFTASTTPACYCPGTQILTPRGEIAVEALAIGDHVVTIDGTPEPILWIGRRSYAGRFLSSAPALLPVRIRAGALGQSLPTRDLLVSPRHALLLDGVLVPAGELVNGTAIVREVAAARVDYLHIELARHDVVLANGVPAETFIDDESRGIFHNAAEYDQLYPNAPRSPARYYAPRVVAGFMLDAIRQRLAGRDAA